MLHVDILFASYYDHGQTSSLPRIIIMDIVIGNKIIKKSVARVHLLIPPTQLILAAFLKDAIQWQWIHIGMGLQVYSGLVSNRWVTMIYPPNDGSVANAQRRHYAFFFLGGGNHHH